MDISIPLQPKSEQLHSDWFQLDYGCNGAQVRCVGGSTETLIYVVFGDDFIAGLRVDRRSWVLLPNTAVTSVTFSALGARNLPPVRQVSEEARVYLQGLGPVQLRVWVNGQEQSLPPAQAAVQGRWLVLSRNDGGQLERMASFDSIRLIEVIDPKTTQPKYENGEVPTWGKSERRY
jgi:hypothetical protein